MDIPYQTILLVTDLFLLGAAARRGRVRWWWIALGSAAAVFAIPLLAEDGFHAARLASWLIFLHVPLVCLVLAVLLFGQTKGSALLAAGIGIVVGIVGVDAFLVEPTALQVTHERIVSNRVDEPFRIAVLADLQTDRITGYEDEVLTRLTAQQPDLILLLGDYVQIHWSQFDRKAEEFRHLLSQHGGLRSPMGTFAVQGNVDRPGRWTRLFEGSDVRVIEKTESVQLEDGLTLTGLSFRDSFNENLAIDRPSDGFHIVFGHGPDYAMGRIDADLLLAGHTHGGQVQIPFLGPLVTLSGVPREWASGRTELGSGKTLFVSRGAGMERQTAPRLRFFCRPEIVVIDVVPATPSSS